MIRVLSVIVITSMLIVSCEAAEPIKKVEDSVQNQRDSNNSITIKPLSTDKTHEGGVDSSLTIFK
jgi:hypothetical protein